MPRMSTPSLPWLTCCWSGLHCQCPQLNRSRDAPVPHVVSATSIRCFCIICVWLVLSVARDELFLPADALATYERALTAGGDAEVAYNAACACARLGHSDRCAQLLQALCNSRTQTLP